MVRRAVLIDGANLYATVKALERELDYRRLLPFLREGAMLVGSPYYFTAVPADDEYSSIRPLLDFLEYNGFTVVKKTVKEFTDSYGARKVKGNIDVEIAVRALQLVQDARIDELVLFSGDGDFTALVKALNDYGVRTIVVSTLMTKPAMVADELRRAATEFWELDKFPEGVFKQPPAR